MRRRYVLTLVLATALIFALAGTALGYWVLPEGEGESADCIVTRAILNTPTENPGAIESARDYYNANCR